MVVISTHVAVATTLMATAALGTPILSIPPTKGSLVNTPAQQASASSVVPLALTGHHLSQAEPRERWEKTMERLIMSGYRPKTPSTSSDAVMDDSPVDEAPATATATSPAWKAEFSAAEAEERVIKALAELIKDRFLPVAPSTSSQPTTATVQQNPAAASAELPASTGRESMNMEGQLPKKPTGRWWDFLYPPKAPKPTHEDTIVNTTDSKTQSATQEMKPRHKTPSKSYENLVNEEKDLVAPAALPDTEPHRKTPRPDGNLIIEEKDLVAPTATASTEEPVHTTIVVKGANKKRGAYKKRTEIASSVFHGQDINEPKIDLESDITHAIFFGPGPVVPPMAKLDVGMEATVARRYENEEIDAEILKELGLEIHDIVGAYLDVLAGRFDPDVDNESC